MENGLFVLVAEDDLDDVEVLKMIFTQYFPDWHCHFVTNGQNVIDFLKERYAQGKPVSFVLSDINMPVKDGITTLAELRATMEYKQLPFIGLSTTIFPPILDRFMQLGGNAFFQKPESMDDYVQILKQISEKINQAQN
ncbi:response regulator [Xanthocytophaga agilis]|uniref:Response regulator n=1 Tax=Xanthocytophaga agilis TaxID=3048010 RepID=A0AAE3UH00_9BACT|nr:response regulator [Xanthocytophaga agilis]MDJ1502128.1 response regulator [Xanthocytophaga agilis]